MSISKFIHNFDLLGNKVKFSVYQMNKSRSIIGAFLTVSIFTIIIWILVIQISDLIFRNSVIQEKRSIADPLPNLNFYENFPLALTILDNQGNLFEVPEKYINITAYLITNIYYLDAQGNPKLSSLSSQLDFGRCQQIYDFDDDLNINYGNRRTSAFQNKTINNNLASYFCLKQNKNMNVSGVEGGSINQYINISISLCNNNTSNILCSGDLLNQLKFSKLHLLLPDYYIDKSNINNPTNLYARNSLVDIDLDFSKKLKFYYQSVEYTTDYGRAISNLTTNYLYIYKEKAIEYRNRINILDFSRFLEINVNSYPIKNVYFRSFLQFQDIISFIGGILNVLLLFATIINSLVNNFKSKINLYENTFPDLVMSSSKVFPSKPHLNNSKEILRVSAFQQNNELNTNINQDKLNIYKDTNAPIITFECNKDIKLKFYERYICCIQARAKKYKLRMANAFIKHYLSYDSIIRFINEFEGFKRLTLDQDQKLLFEQYNKISQHFDMSYPDLDQDNNFIKREIQIRILESIKNINMKSHKTVFETCLVDFFLKHNKLV